MMIQQQVVNHRDGEEDRRARCGKNFGDEVRRWFFAAENRRGAIQQRKRKAVSEAVSERQSRRRKQTVVLCDPQHLATESLIRVEDVGLPVDGSFRFAGATGRVEDERRIVFLGGREVR
jgi:hypothetical protein